MPLDAHRVEFGQISRPTLAPNHPSRRHLRKRTRRRPPVRHGAPENQSEKPRALVRSKSYRCMIAFTEEFHNSPICLFSHDGLTLTWGPRRRLSCRSILSPQAQTKVHLKPMSARRSTPIAAQLRWVTRRPVRDAWRDLSSLVKAVISGRFIPGTARLRRKYDTSRPKSVRDLAASLANSPCPSQYQALLPPKLRRNVLHVTQTHQTQRPRLRDPLRKFPRRAFVYATCRDFAVRPQRDGVSGDRHARV